MHQNRPTIGIDLGDRKSHFCILDDTGKITAEGALPTSPVAFASSFTRSLPP